MLRNVSQQGACHASFTKSLGCASQYVCAGHFFVLALTKTIRPLRCTLTTLQPSGPSCQACSKRAPHVASSTYVVADDAVSAADAAIDYRCPPGAPPGTRFAVMDPVPCHCVTAGAVGASGHGSNANSCQEEGVGRKRKAGSAAGGGGGEVLQRTWEPYEPPVLWPVNRDKIAYQRGRGPVAHGLRLQSAYAQQGDAWGTGEPAFSSYHHMFKVTTPALTRSGYSRLFQLSARHGQ